MERNGKRGHLQYIFHPYEPQASCHIHCEAQSTIEGFQSKLILIISQNLRVLWLAILASHRESKLRLSLNIYCVSVQFHERYLQDVG